MTSGPLAGTVLDEILDERTGAFAFHRSSGRLEADVVYASIETSALDCEVDAGLNVDGKMVLLEATSNCDGELHTIASRLAARGAAALLLDSQRCLCANLAAGDVLADQGVTCASTSCLTYLSPRTSLDDSAELVRLPVLTLSRAAAGLVIDCLAAPGAAPITNTTRNGVAGLCSPGGGAATATRLALTWGFPGAPSGSATQVALEVFSTPTELVNPLKEDSFLAVMLPVVRPFVEVWSTRQQVLDGTQLPLQLQDVQGGGNGSSSSVGTLDCSAAGGLSAEQAEVCASACIGGGRYCHESAAAGDGGAAIPGAAVVAEALRQACLWEQVDATNSSVGLDVAVWFEYTTQMQQRCMSSAASLTELCSADVHAQLNLTFGTTDACVATTGGYEGANTVLEAQKSTTRAYVEGAGLVKTPSVSVNGVVVPYGNSWGNWLSGLCAGVDTEPDFCACIFNAGKGELREEADLLLRCFGIASAGSVGGDDQGGDDDDDGGDPVLIALLAVGCCLLAGCLVVQIRRRRLASAQPQVAEQELPNIRTSVQADGPAQGGAGAAGAGAAAPAGHTFGFGSRRPRLPNFFGKGTSTVGADARYPNKATV